MAYTDTVLQHTFGSGQIRYGSFYNRIGKRAFDLLLACVLLPLIAPVVLGLAALARLDGGPAFFGHARIGQHGKAFICWKLRTMAVDAEERLTALLEKDPVSAQDWAARRKLDNDPRVTWCGGWMRRLSLDELPQIWNVLRGDMSFVGPRPVTQEELSYYGQNASAYLSQRPGVTGLWQVFGRSDGGYGQRVMLDAIYVGQQRFLTDLGLIGLTFVCLIFPTGR